MKNATCLKKFWWNFQGMLIMLKMEFHFFVLFLKWIETKILPLKDFWDFFSSAHFYCFRMTTFLQEFTRNSDLLKFSGYLLWFQRYKHLPIYIFNSVWQQCNDFCRKFQVFILWNVIIWKVYMIERFWFLQITVKMQANPWIFLTVYRLKLI